MYVYVLNKNNQPLMPTIRAKHVRELLNSGKAVVLNSNPFAIKLKYETEDIIQYLYCGMDTGRENIGVAVSNEVGECVFRGILQTNNKTIKQNMEDRKALRNERRRHKRQKKQRKALKNNTSMKSDNETIYQNKKVVKSKQIRYPKMQEYAEHKIIKGKEAKFANRKREES